MSKIILFITIISFTAIMPQDSNFSHIYKTPFDNLTELSLKVRQLTDENKILRAKEEMQSRKIKELEIEDLLNRKTLSTYLFYKQAGTLYLWKWISPELIKKTRQYCEQWKHLAEIKDNRLDLVEFMQGVIHNESNYDVICKTLEVDGTYSYGITQLNDNGRGSLQEIQILLPAELRWRNIKTDAEANIAGRYIWIKLRLKAGKSWAIMAEDRGWTLYWKLMQIKG